MRILHLVDRLTGRGGAYWHLAGVLDALARGGHAQHVAAGSDDGSLPVPVPVTVVPALAERTRAAVADRLDDVAAAVAPDAVHVHTVVNPAALEWAAGRAAIMTVQDHRYFCPARGKWTKAGEPCRTAMDHDACAACFEDAAYFGEMLGLTRERLAAVRRMARVVVLSRYMAGELAAAGVDPARMAVVPPFVHALDVDARPDGPPCVLFVGRLTEAKGVLDAVAAWRASRVELPLVCAGTGPLREAVARAGASVLGWLDRDRMARTYARARALLMPSRWQEPYGIAGIEALACGVPVVAWRSGGIEEWHPRADDRGAGALVAWGDVEGLACALAATVAAGPAMRPRSAREETPTLVDLYRTAAEPPAGAPFGLR